jgi:hypothetical protein
MVEESIKLANLDYKSHYFYHEKSQQGAKFNINSFDDYSYNINKHCKYDLLKYNNLTQFVFVKTLNCRHLLHDDSWIKITNKNNILKDIEELGELTEMDLNSIAFVNSINSDNISNITFLQCVYTLNERKFNGYTIEFKYIDFDEDTENVKWIVIYCKKMI